MSSKGFLDFKSIVFSYASQNQLENVIETKGPYTIS